MESLLCQEQRQRQKRKMRSDLISIVSHWKVPSGQWNWEWHRHKQESHPPILGVWLLASQPQSAPNQSEGGAASWGANSEESEPPKPLGRGSPRTPQMLTPNCGWLQWVNRCRFRRGRPLDRPQSLMVKHENLKTQSAEGASDTSIHA